MMNETNIKKMEELLGNEDFAQKIADAHSNENAYRLFVENGVDATFDDFTTFLEEQVKCMHNERMAAEGDELDPEVLDQVNGGIGGDLLMLVFAWWAKRKDKNRKKSGNMYVETINSMGL